MIELGAKPECLTVQTDLYLDDPLRNFAELDYALRIRKCGESYGLTFKGPNLDATSKTRKELEVALNDDSSAESLNQIFISLGYQEVAKVTKTREQMSLEWSSSTISIALDQVEELGNFVELEIVAADDAAADAARNCLQSLADKLGLEGSIRTSYLELLLAERS